tara:strand:- start:1624 stop:3690 length:2067 start_codon:yes stop_codon:yes gene_type:complete
MEEIKLPFKEEEEIQTDKWMPSHKPLEYPKAFVRWIDSINKGWRNMTKYKPFEIYVKQSEQWIKEKDDITNYRDIDAQEDYIVQEYQRCQENTLYFGNKYGWLKEGDAKGGTLNYDAWKAQQILLFLLDSGYNCIIGKARQIGFTTTMGLAAMKRINFNKSYFCKFITHTKDKGEEIFRDKIRWGFGQIPEWLRQPVYNDAHNILSLQEKGKKGSTKGAYSRIEVATPVIDAINGGSPNLVLIDEIGLFDLFGKMMREGRPTLFYFNPDNNLMEMRRQLFAWGTGGEMSKGGAVFESEFKATLNAWRERNFEYGIIPLFFDAYAREGMNENIFKKEKKYYYSKTGVEQQTSRVQFHQHYPITIDDMFLRTAKTIIPIAECNRHLVKIYHLSPTDQPQYGYFEPIYNTASPTPDGVLPYKLLDAKWIPTEGMEDERTTSVVFKHPPTEEKWEYRFYQGTDPINSETGHSKMSSSIWDAYTNTCASMVFYRERDFKQCYLQCLLQGIYYDRVHKRGVKELIERNIGSMYFDFQEQVGFGKRVVPNNALPPFLQTPSSGWWGISNKTNTAGHIANKVIEMTDAYADNIYISWFFLQLKTFVEKDLRTGNSSRQTRFQAGDLKYDYDDGIFSMGFAYINAQAHQRYEPQKIDAIKETIRRQRYVQNAQTGWRMRLAEVDGSGKIIRYISGNY